MDRGPWWRVDADRDGGRWPLVAAGALLSTFAGVAIVLVADGVGPVVGAKGDRGEPLAEVRHAGRVLAELHRLASGPGEDDTIGARTTGGARTDGTGGARRGRLRLEHRRGADIDLDPANATGTAGREEQEVPAVVVRLADEHGEPVAGAHAYRHGDLDDWACPVVSFRSRLHGFPTAAARPSTLKGRGRAIPR